jgi:hypothetical protein
MSREAIAAALARTDLSSGERLVAFSLASFADREHHARPGTPAAAARAGMQRSGYLEARDRLVRRGLVVVEAAAKGRGKASTLALPFAAAGPWWDGDINAELFEAVLGYSRAQGSARLLVAALAALADERGVVAEMTTEQLCAAAGVSDRTYRRMRGPLLASGAVVVHSSPGGRGNTNRWEIPDPRAGTAAAAPRPRRRVAPPGGVSPLIATIAPPADEHLPFEISGSVERERSGEVVGGVKGCQDRMVSPENRPASSGVSALNPCQDRTLPPQTPAETPAETPAITPAITPAETPAPIARAGREPQNPRIPEDPPTPLSGGQDTDSILVEETYVTERGRQRRRVVTVDLVVVRAGLAAGSEADRTAWEQVRMLLLQTVGESTFEIWLEPLELIAVDGSSTLILSAPDATVSWIRERFGGLLNRAAQGVGRPLRIADEVERRAAETLAPMTAAPPGGAPGVSPARTPSGGGHVSSDACPTREGDRSSGSPAGTSPDTAAHARARRSAHPSSYTDVHNQAKEMS